MSELGEIEALLYIAGEEGIAVHDLAQLTKSTKDHIMKSLQVLEEKYQNSEDSGLCLIETAKRYKLAIKKEYFPTVELFAKSPYMQKLTRAQIETLAVIAYKQPITRSQIEEIRGVTVSNALQKLKLRDLILDLGTLDAPGRPILYGTTDYFLNYFGLNDLTELPELDLDKPVDNQSISLFDDEQFNNNDNN